MRTPAVIALVLLTLQSTPLLAGTVTYIYTDPQGTTLAEADVNGNVTADFDYRPYGAVVLGPAPNGPGYTGHVNDPDTGLVYMQARYYDPSMGRFLSEDAIKPVAGNPNTFNRFSYANNNPIVNVDPDGRCTGSHLQAGNGNCLSTGTTTTKLTAASITAAGLMGRRSARIDGGRPLAADEIDAAKTIYSNKIDYDSVRVVKGKYAITQGSNYAVTPNGNIYFPGDCGSLVSCGGGQYEGMFIHEMAHVLQYQSGINVLGDGLLLQTGKFLSFGIYNPYKFRFDPSRKFSSYNIEQQGDIAVKIYYGVYKNNIDLKGVRP